MNAGVTAPGSQQPPQESRQNHSENTNVHRAVRGHEEESLRLSPLRARELSQAPSAWAGPSEQGTLRPAVSRVSSSLAGCRPLPSSPSDPGERPAWPRLKAPSVLSDGTVDKPHSPQPKHGREDMGRCPHCSCGLETCPAPKVPKRLSEGKSPPAPARGDRPSAQATRKAGV